MKEVARPVNAMTEIPPKTREFLARLSEEDLDTLEDGVKLVNAMRRVGRVMRWVIVGIAGIFLGGVMLWEALLRVIGYVRTP